VKKVWGDIYWFWVIRQTTSCHKPRLYVALCSKKNVFLHQVCLQCKHIVYSCSSCSFLMVTELDFSWTEHADYWWHHLVSVDKVRRWYRRPWRKIPASRIPEVEPNHSQSLISCCIASAYTCRSEILWKLNHSFLSSRTSRQAGRIMPTKTLPSAYKESLTVMRYDSVMWFVECILIQINFWEDKHQNTK